MMQPPVEQSEIRCLQCGYNLTGVTIGGLCPECGMPIEDSLRPAFTAKTCGAATACLVIGIVSLVVCAVAGPIAIGMYYKAMADIRTGKYSASSKTLATAGLVLGIISTVILALGVLVIGLGGF